MQRFALGQPVSRAAMQGSSLIAHDTAPTSPPQQAPPQCFSRVLASPIFDHGDLVIFGNPARAAVIKEAFARLKYRPGPLLDAVVVHTGSFAYIRVFLIVPVRLLELKQLIVASSDANDTLFTQHAVSKADIVPPSAFPASWHDPANWWNFFVQVLEEQAALGQKIYVPVIVEIKGPAQADRVQVGYLPEARRQLSTETWRPYFVAAIELLRTSELTRSSYDITEQKKKQGVLNDALGLDSADNALLLRDTAYQIRVTYNAERQRRTNGTVTDVKAVPGVVKSFWFHTDDQAPRRVDPWILVALPGEGEQHVFAGEPIRIVFATNNLAKIFDAYGKKLQARVKAASFRPVPSTPSVPHPFPFTEAHLQPVAATILSPWEGAIKSLAAANPCIASSGSTVRHTMVTMAIPLDTDYVIDIEMLDKLAADGTAGERVWRGSFTTGHFLTLDLFAKSFRTARLTHRGVATANIGGLQAIGVTFATHSPEGSEFDNALITAGLDAQPVPKAPRMIVFWDATLPQPQPAAILIDSSEPMWRSRLIPTQVIDAGPAAAKRYDMVSQPWVDLRQQPGGDDIVDKIVPAPGGQRALVTLKPNSRGKHLRLALCRIHHPEPYLDGPASTDQLVNLLDYTLGNAPWEEVD